MRLLLALALVVAFAACRRREPAAPKADSVAAPAAAVSSRTAAPDAAVAGVADPGPGSPSPATKPAAAKAESPAPQPAGPTPDGEQLFQTNCAQCHMANGSGVPYLQPDIRHSARISAEDPQYLLALILHGSVVLGEGAKAFENDMPPFEHLSDAEIAALATRVREKFATPKPAKPLTPADVAAARAQPVPAQ